jgi:hypothetical protein
LVLGRASLIRSTAPTARPRTAASPPYASMYGSACADVARQVERLFADALDRARTAKARCAAPSGTIPALPAAPEDARTVVVIEHPVDNGESADGASETVRDDAACRRLSAEIRNRG